MKQTETQLVRSLLDYLAATRIFAWRSNSGAMTATYKGKTRFVRFSGVRGLPDIIAVVHGIFVGIEAKLPGRKPTPDQIQFRERLTKAGGEYIIAHSIDELDAALRTFR